MFDYTIMNSRRKTLSFGIDENGNMIVKAPLNYGREDVNQIIMKHQKLIQNSIEKQRKIQEGAVPLTESEICQLKEGAKRILTQKVDYYAKIMNVKPTGIKITGAKKQLGSCSGKNSICFSYSVMLYSEKAIDYVVVHELAHIVHHNHSKNFYDCVKSVLPDYKEREKQLYSGKQKKPEWLR